MMPKTDAPCPRRAGGDHAGAILSSFRSVAAPAPDAGASATKGIMLVVRGVIKRMRFGNGVLGEK